MSSNPKFPQWELLRMFQLTEDTIISSSLLFVMRIIMESERNHIHCFLWVWHFIYRSLSVISLKNKPCLPCKSWLCRENKQNKIFETCVALKTNSNHRCYSHGKSECLHQGIIQTQLNVFWVEVSPTVVSYWLIHSACLLVWFSAIGSLHYAGIKRGGFKVNSLIFWVFCVSLWAETLLQRSMCWENC